MKGLHSEVRSSKCSPLPISKKNKNPPLIAIDMERYPVRFVSLGPGDPDLITLAAYKALQQCDFIYYPTTASPSGKTLSRAEDIMLAHGIDTTKFRPYALPMSKDRTKALEVYGEVASRCKADYRAGLSVVVAAEGDAGFYSSTHYISDILLGQKYPFIYIAGVPAFIAAGAAGGLSITRQDEELQIIPGNATPGKLCEAMAQGRTVLIMKLSRCESVVKEFLSKENVAAIYFEYVGTDKEFISSCIEEDMLPRRFPYFSMLRLKPKP